MPRLSSPEQLAAYRQQQVELAKKIKAAEAQRRAKERVDDLRRMQVLGAAVLAYFAQSDRQEQRPEFLRTVFKGRAMSAHDRNLFQELMTPVTPTPPLGG